jgi:hypothetical protein
MTDQRCKAIGPETLQQPVQVTEHTAENCNAPKDYLKVVWSYVQFDSARAQELAVAIRGRPRAGC